MTLPATENQTRILEEMKQQPSVSASDLSDRIGISTRKVQANIRVLRERNLIRRVGPDKGGYWELIK